MKGTARVATAKLAGALLVLAAVIGSGFLGSRVSAPGPPNHLTVWGYYSGSRSIAVESRVVEGGTWRVGYSMNVLFLPTRPDSLLRCSLIDASGRVEFFADGIRYVPAGEWTTISFETFISLPSLTLGIRCDPTQDGTISAIFRAVTIYALPPLSEP